MHETIEDVLQKNKFRNIAENEEEQRRFNNAIAIAKKLDERLDILGIEKIVFDVDLALAGTIDLFGQSKKTGEYIIVDHKSNADLGLDNKYKSFALDPISHIPDTNFGHYQIQLNLYQYLLKYGGYVPKDAKFKMYLNHVTSDFVNLIEAPDRQNEIKDMMIEYLLKYKKT
jgi:ATP-dependent exoDNAse (exonuclease V) beta subunit